MRNDVNHKEASEIVQALFQERAATIRRNGVKKVIGGTMLACVPVVAWFIFQSVGIIPMKIFALTIMVGLYGAYMILKGTIMFTAPKSEPGDVSDQ
jgi:hypothetical protein